jgi:hypothetical protein
MEFQRVDKDKPMMADDDEHPGIVKIKHMWERGEFDKLDEMVRFYDAVKNLGVISGMVKNVVIWFGVIAGGYLALTGHLTEWIRSIR